MIVQVNEIRHRASAFNIAEILAKTNKFLRKVQDGFPQNAPL